MEVALGAKDVNDAEEDTEGADESLEPRFKRIPRPRPLLPPRTPRPNTRAPSPWPECDDCRLCDVLFTSSCREWGFLPFP